MNPSFLYSIIQKLPRGHGALAYWLLVHRQLGGEMTYLPQPAVEETIVRQHWIVHGRLIKCISLLWWFTLNDTMVFMFTEKLQRWKKEKKFRKIIQQQIDELNSVDSQQVNDRTSNVRTEQLQVISRILKFWLCRLFRKPPSIWPQFLKFKPTPLPATNEATHPSI